MNSESKPPEIVYYSETGGKTAPFYLTLRGLRSAFKTSWYARWNRADWPPPAWKGTVTWERIEVD